MCVVDAQGRFSEVNRGWESILGYTPDELLGREFMDFVHPNDVEATVGAWQASQESGVTDFINRYRHKTGRFVTMQWRSRPVGDKVFAVARDATEASRLARDPAVSEERYRHAFLELPVPAVIQASSGAIVAANSAALEVLGLTEDQAKGRTSMDPRWRAVDEASRTLPGDQHPAMVALRTGEPVRGFVMGVFDPHRSEMRWLLLDSQPIFDEDSDQPALVITTIVDMRRRGLGAAPDAGEIALLRHRTGHDPLTGLRNRNDLHSEASKLLSGAHKSGKNIGVLYTDIDHFKYINDAISHDAGDDVLRQVGDTLVSCMRQGDLVARLGGDEFVVVLADVRDHAAAQQVAEVVRGAVAAQTYTYGRRDIPVSVSLGVAASAESESFDQVLERADAALRKAKQRGRDRTVVISKVQWERPSGGVTAEIIAAALDGERLETFFQPIVTLPEGRTLGFESLARLRLPDGSVVPAQKWLGVAARNGLLFEVDRASSRAAIRALSGLPEHQWVTKNVSADRLHDARASREIIELLHEFEVTPGRLTVEITEQVALHATRTVLGNIHALMEAGITLALDDFGTGYSSIAQLRDFPVQVVKLDRTYTAGLVAPAESDEAAAGRDRVWGMVRGLADMCRHMGITTVAEGIETEAQARAVTEAGWQMGQGWHFGRESETPRESVATPLRVGKQGAGRTERTTV